MHPSARRTLRAFVLALVLSLGIGGLTVTSPVAAIPIEGIPNYHPQKTCSPRAKAGTLMLQNHLLRRYKGTRSMGISRACTASGISEHKEGRAFDWALNVKSKRDRGYAKNFVHRLMRTDKAGHRKALARRMGIMYLIWNDHIWSASKNYRKRRYVHPACGRIRGCSKTLRHRDHMHISLTWPGARAKTSWYVKKRNGSKKAAQPKKAKKKAQPKRTAPKKAQRKKAERKKAQRKKERREKAQRKKAQRKKAAAKKTRATKPKAKKKTRKSRSGAGKRRTSTRQKKTARSSKRRALPKLPDGVLNLRKRPYRRLRVPADGQMVESEFKLREGVTYSLTAAGLYTYGHTRQVGDAACTWSSKEDAWVPEPGRRTQRRFGRLALQVNGSLPFDGECRGSHRYRTEITPTRDQYLRMRVALRNPAPAGGLVVVVGRKKAAVADALPTYPDLTPAPAPADKPQGFGLIAETVEVDASGSGAYTSGSLSPDAKYRLTVSGVVRMGRGVRSDGKCVEVRGTWYRKASIDPRVPQEDHGKLYVDGAPFRGRSAGSEACAEGHTSVFTPERAGKLRLDLWDPLDTSDNRGTLEVKVQRLTSIPTPRATRALRVRKNGKRWTQARDWFEVDAAAEEGTISTIRLRKGVPAQVFITGHFSTGGRRADASCVRTGDGWVEADPGVEGQDPLNVWIEDQEVSWRALGRNDDCSEEHRYTTRFTPTKNGALRLSVFDLDHRDNKGKLQVTVLRAAR